jgi:AGCS family alanine or glycine:cation symporter
MLFAMSIANLIGLYLLARVLKAEVVGYLGRVRTGEFVRVK